MPWSLEYQAHLAGLLACRGDEGGAERILGKLGDGNAYGVPSAFVTYFLARGDIDQAADWAARAIEQRWPQIVLVLRTFAADLRRSPRWPALVKMMNLPDAGCR